MCLDFGCQITQFVGRVREVERDHVGALLGEPLTMHPPGTSGRPGDHDDLAVKSGHHETLIKSKPL
ncbi:Uncharacterised protein [Mycobacterium tuberculosis]|nr:Uncharacterised protein [Mycobacterium tuberculosis]